MSSSNSTALVIIDVQNCFVNRYTGEIPERITHYIKQHKFDHVLITAFVLNKHSNFYKLLDWKAFYSLPDMSLHNVLAPFSDRGKFFPRSTYSVFKSKKFLSFLTRNRVKEIELCGIDSDGCVLASAFDAFDLGYNVRILKSLTASSGGEKYDRAAKVIISRNLEK